MKSLLNYDSAKSTKTHAYVKL